METDGRILNGHRVLVLVAALVALAAVAVQLFIYQGLHAHLSLGYAGNFLFQWLETEFVGFALPAAYFRVAVPPSPDESMVFRIIAASVVAMSALVNIRLWQEDSVEDFALLSGVLAASYAVHCRHAAGGALAVLVACSTGTVVALIVTLGWVLPALTALAGLATAYLANAGFSSLRDRGAVPDSALARWSGTGLAAALGLTVVPTMVLHLAKFLLPIQEIGEAYEVVGMFTGPANRDRLALRLLVVTALCQVSLGYLGIAFLRQAQTRKNALLSVGDGKVTARDYAHLVFVYMLAAAVPYMLQRTIMENVNGYVEGHTEREVERMIRIGSFFPEDVENGTDLLLAAIKGSKYTVEGYTDAFNSIVMTIYGLMEVKLFALPKLMLLPGMLVSQPWLVVSVLPTSIALDVGRARMITTMTRHIEALSREIQELANRRRKIEQHDTKNEELIRRGASIAFTEATWRDIAVDIEANTLRFHALISLRGFINALYKQELLTPGIELVLAWLLEFKQILISDIFVYQRVVEETIDFLLTRFRMDAKLASLKTNLDRVRDLHTRLNAIRTRGYATWSLDQTGGAIHITDLKYVRGSLEVHFPELVLRTGRIYAVTGPNGSGKSSLFGILMSCGKRATMLPSGLEIRKLQRLVLPSDDIVEITQQFYCPMFVRPLAWMLQRRDLDELEPEELQRCERQIGQLSGQFQFHRADGREENVTAEEAGLTPSELNAEVEDWYGMLSGGQRAKAEFMRKVFLQKSCPGILLIDEAFAPLDPNSKLLVQQRLKEFCADSVVLVIYHGGAKDTCVPSDGFFDESLHFSNGTASLTATC